VCFENTNIFFCFEKRSELIQRGRCTYIVVKSEVVGLASEVIFLKDGQAETLRLGRLFALAPT
jgi:hypothetical protein